MSNCQNLQMGQGNIFLQDNSLIPLQSCWKTSSYRDELRMPIIFTHGFKDKVTIYSCSLSPQTISNTVFKPLYTVYQRLRVILDQRKAIKLEHTQFKVFLIFLLLEEGTICLWHFEYCLRRFSLTVGMGKHVLEKSFLIFCYPDYFDILSIW